MSIISIIRFFRGTVRFSVRDGFLERFINLCAQNRVPVWDGRRQGSRYTACTTLRGSRRLPELAQRAGVILEPERRGGAPVLLHRYRKRTGLFAGIALVAAAILVMGQFVWQVEVLGLQTIPEQEVIAALEELGVRRGVLRRDIDAREVERRLMIRLDEAAWVAVNLRGSRAVVEIQERVIPPERVDDHVPHNVVAAKPGFITYMEVYNGQPTVKVGDSVDVGEMLVSGIMEDKKARNRTVHARARVLAQTREELRAEVPYRQESFTVRGVAVRRYLNILSLQLPLFWGTPIEGPYKLETVVHDIPLISSIAPITWSREAFLLLEAHQTDITPQEARAMAEAQLRELEERSFGDAGIEIIQRELNGQELPDRFLLEGVYLCQEDISQEKEILTGEEVPGLEAPPLEETARGKEAS